MHLLALDEIHAQIERTHELIDSLPAEGGFTYKEPEPFVSPVPAALLDQKRNQIPDSPWWLALILDNWLKVPGGGMFVLGVWVFTSLNATSPGGRGDWRAFHYVVYNIALLIAVSILLLAIRPMLSSYAVMNTIIFTWLFVWGYLSYSIRGVTIPMQVGMLTIVGILGLNGQELDLVSGHC